MVNILQTCEFFKNSFIAGSIALTGFGLDSVVETLSALILIWRLKAHSVTSWKHEKKIEEGSKRFVTITFFILGLYILIEAFLKLYNKEKPDPSIPGILIAATSVLLMPLLAKKKYELGEKIGSRALIADSKETLVCSLLSIALLIGLVANSIGGFWQADPLIGILISIFLFREGFEGLEIEDKRKKRELKF